MYTEIDLLLCVIHKVILFGIAFSFTLVNLSRFIAALKLRKGDFENHINLIQRISRDKMKGQRGGSVGDDKALLVSFWCAFLSCFGIRLS